MIITLKFTFTMNDMIFTINRVKYVSSSAVHSYTNITMQCYSFKTSSFANEGITSIS